MHNHLRHIGKLNWTQFAKTMIEISQQVWDKRIQQCSNQLHILEGIPRTAIIGFCTPFLKYNQATFSTLSHQHFIYDFSIEEGHTPQPHQHFIYDFSIEEGHTPQLLQHEMQKAIADFIAYALTKPAVRLDTAKNVIQWCQNPKSL